MNDKEFKLKMLGEEVLSCLLTAITFYIWILIQGILGINLEVFIIPIIFIIYAIIRIIIFESNN